MSGVLGGLPIAMILVAGVCAPIAGWYATQRLRNPATWFVLGALIGPLALVLLAAAPPGRCPACEALVVGWPTWCDNCGARLRDGAAPEVRPGVVRGTRQRSRTAAAPAAGPVQRLRTASIVERASIVAPPTPIDTARGGLRRESHPVRARPRPHPTPTPVRSGQGDWTPPAITASHHEIATSTTDVSGDVLSTGVYISGNARLEIGACYAIARAGDQLRVFGPVDAGQLTVRHEGPITDFDVTAMDDRVIIAGREGRSSLAIVFRTIGGMRAAELESALAPSVAGFGGHR